MAYSPGVQRVLSQAAEEARRCGSARIEPEHLLIAVCRLAYTSGSVSNLAEDLLLLERLFNAAGIRPADLAERLFQEMRQDSQCKTILTCEHSKRYDEVLREAMDYADEEPKSTGICLRHLIEPLIVKLGANPVFRMVMADLGGDLRQMREQLGFHGSTITTKMCGDGHTVGMEYPQQPLRQIDGPDSSSSSVPSSQAPRAASVPSETIKAKLVRADEDMKREDWVGAIACYEEALKVFFPVSPAWNNLGVAYMRTRRFPQAKVALHNAIKIDSYNADAYANLGVLLARDMDQPEEGEKWLKEALRLNPKHQCRLYLEALQGVRVGEQHLTLRRPKDGRALQAHDVRLPLGMEARADDLEARGEFREALAIYDRFLQAHPHSLQALNNAATLYNRLIEPRKARDLLERAVDLAPTYVKAWNNLGMARAMLGDTAGAKNAFDMALKHDPRNTIARQNLQVLRMSELPGHGAGIGLTPPMKPLGAALHQDSSNSTTRQLRPSPVPKSVALKTGPWLDQLQHAADYKLFPKALTRYMLVCVFLGAIDMAVGMGFHKTSWLYAILAALGGLLALEGILSRALRRPRGLLEEGYILFTIGVICTILFFLIVYHGTTGNEGTTWGRLVLLALLGPFQFRAASDSFGRYRRFAEMSLKPPSSEASQHLEEIRQEIVATDVNGATKTIEFFNRAGRWKARLKPEVGIFVSVDLGDVLFIARNKVEFKQPLPNRPAVWLQLGKTWMSVRMVEPSLSIMRKWCPNVRLLWQT